MQLFFSEIYNKIYRNSIDILFIEYKMFYSLFIISKLFVTIQYFSGLEACGMDIGKRMKELRIQYGLTQQELADRSELTKGFISQLERDLTSPSIATLMDILQCLGTTTADFFTEAPDEQIVFGKADYFEKIDTDLKNEIKWIIPNAQKNMMEPILLTLEAGGETYPDNPHEGEEFGYVLQGSIAIHLGNKLYRAKKGESFYFTPDKKHYLTSKTGAIILWVSSPPSF